MARPVTYVDFQKGIIHIYPVYNLLEVDVPNIIGPDVVVVYDAKACLRYYCSRLRYCGLDIVRHRLIVNLNLSSSQDRFEERIAVLVKRGVCGYGIEAVGFERRRCLTSTG